MIALLNTCQIVSTLYYLNVSIYRFSFLIQFETFLIHVYMNNFGLYPEHSGYYVMKFWFLFKSCTLVGSQPVRVGMFILVHLCWLWFKCQFSFQSLYMLSYSALVVCYLEANLKPGC